MLKTSLPLVGNDSHIAGMWNLADRLIQQVALQQKNGQDPDCVPVEMNIKQMVRQLVLLKFMNRVHYFQILDVISIEDSTAHLKIINFCDI